MEEHFLIELTEAFIKLHRNQFERNGIPQHYWNTLCSKLKDEIYDAGNYFQIVQRVDEDDNLIGYKAVCCKHDGLKTNDPLGIFLVDHAWTYRLTEARNCLSEMDDLANRMKNLMSIEIDRNELNDEEYKAELIESIMTNMWRFNQTYNFLTTQMSDDDREPLWYIMDEFGSSIRHSEEPNMKCAPFYYIPTNSMYTLIWPLTDIGFNEEVTRDYVNGIKNPLVRKAKLVPWFDKDLTDVDTKHEEPSDTYFMAGREDELMPDNLASLSKYDPKSIENRDKKYRVFTDLEMVRDFLTDEKFTFTDNQSDADIIFIRKHYKDYKTLAESNLKCMINQFPFENVITVKDLLAITCRRSDDSYKWLPITYNLNYELPKFVSYYQQRDKTDLDNYWIIKPWNLARSIDTHVTNDLNKIIRLQESGPKIACKYITNPVLFYREELGGSVKFDIRYIVLLHSIQPLIIYTYNVFWLRFANKPYSLDNLEDYEKHFTVMNYRPVNLKQINCDEFVPMFEQQYKNHKWAAIQDKIFKMIKQVFEGAITKEPPRGFANYPQSRAMYAIDLMLDWRIDANNNENERTIEPMICEINFMPDCTRACKYHPSFFNDVFYTLFLNEAENHNVTKIC